MLSSDRAAAGLCAALVAVAVTVATGIGVDTAFDLALYGVLTLVLATGGTLILRRHPRHGTGRLLCGLAAWLAVQELLDSYGYHRDWPGNEYAEWVTSASWIGELAFWPLILLTFPTGRLPSRRWRVVPPVLLIGALLAAAGYGLGTDELGDRFVEGRSPLVVDWLPTDLMFDIGMPLVLLATVLSAASLAVRWRGSLGVERLQLKWFVAAAALLGTVTPFAVALWSSTVIVQIAQGVAVSTLPVAASVAILRYRLYDIDVVANRALVYSSLTATLIGAYLLTVLLSQLVLPARSDLGVAVSTLTVAALFNPARRRLQALVDRRFFRRRFDAQRTLDAFGARLRDELDLDALSGELRGVVSETMQPAHLSMWLRELG